MPKRDVEANGLMIVLAFNYLDKHDAVNNSADAPTRAGISVICAKNIH
jgi:hypothetical protein